MKKFQINSSDMIKLRVYWVALGVMCHVEVMLYNYKTTLNNCIYIQLRRRPPEDEQGNVRNM